MNGSWFIEFSVAVACGRDRSVISDHRVQLNRAAWLRRRVADRSPPQGPGPALNAGWRGESCFPVIPGNRRGLRCGVGKRVGPGRPFSSPRAGPDTQPLSPQALIAMLVRRIPGDTALIAERNGVQYASIIRDRPVPIVRLAPTGGSFHDKSFQALSPRAFSSRVHQNRGTQAPAPYPPACRAAHDNFSRRIGCKSRIVCSEGRGADELYGADRSSCIIYT